MRNKNTGSIFAKTRIFSKRICYSFLVAFMIGISNVVKQENRTILDTRFHIEQKQEQAEAEDSF